MRVPSFDKTPCTDEAVLAVSPIARSGSFANAQPGRYVSARAGWAVKRCSDNGRYATISPG